MPALSKADFFAVMKKEGLALTFDDVRLETRASEFAPAEVDLRSRFSRNVPLKLPIVSAAMDTVTDAKMAIAIACMGGIGVIHAGFTAEEQRREVRRVKLFLNGRIDNPVCVYGTDTLQDILSMCKDRQYEFRTFPVIDKKNSFIGLLTQNDFDFAADMKKSAKAVMTPASQVTVANPKTSINQAYKMMLKSKKKTLPLLNNDGTVAGLYIFSDVNRIVGGDSGMYNVDANGRLRVAAAVPTDEEALDRVRDMRKYLDVAVIDSAQGDSKFARQTLTKLKKAFPDLDVVVGNISSASSAKALVKLGADGIKVGQGPGSICTTRIETGIGSPQVSAVYECVAAINDPDIPVCADGGLRSPGDISIALAAGAHSVMMGSMLAGTNEAPGELIELESGARVMLYRGMGSPSALRDSAASRKRYGVEGAGVPLAEGVESYIPYKGPVRDVLDRYTKALRKSMSYVGSADIKHHRTDTRFIRITNAGLNESHPHDVNVITN